MCDLSCKTKIIINGDNIVGLLRTLCAQAEYARDHNQEITTGNDIIKTLNQMEDLACLAQRQFLHGIGYDGPLPKSLS